MDMNELKGLIDAFYLYKYIITKVIPKLLENDTLRLKVILKEEMNVLSLEVVNEHIFLVAFPKEYNIITHEFTRMLNEFVTNLSLGEVKDNEYIFINDKERIMEALNGEEQRLILAEEIIKEYQDNLKIDRRIFLPNERSYDCLKRKK